MASRWIDATMFIKWRERKHLTYFKNTDNSLDRHKRFVTFEIRGSHGVAIAEHGAEHGESATMYASRSDGIFSRRSRSITEHADDDELRVWEETVLRSGCCHGRHGERNASRRATNASGPVGDTSW